MRPRSLRAVLAALLALAAAPAALPPTPAAAQPASSAANPYDAQAAELARDAIRERGPAGILPLLELWRAWDETTPSAVLEALEGVAEGRRVPAERRAYAEALRARALIRAGRLEDAEALVDRLGYVTSWQLIGPFDNEGKQGFERAFGPEEAAMQPFAAAVRYPGKEREVAWRPYPPISRVGYVDFDALFRPRQNVCGYAQTTVHSERAQPLALWVGAGGATKIWWNGEEVHREDVYRSPDPDRHVALVGAHEGANRLLVKSCITDGAWGFYLRVVDPRNRPARGVRVDGSTIEDAAGADHGVARLPRAPETILARLEAAAEGEDAPAAALYDLARYLVWTGADDPNEQRGRQLAARAAEAEPSLAHLELAARLATQRSETTKYVQRAMERYESRPAARLLHAQVTRAGLHPEDALPLLEGVPEEGVLGMEAAVLRAGILQDMDLPQAAWRLVDEVAQRAPEAHGWLRLRAEYASAAGRHDRAIALREQAVAARWNDRPSRRVLVADAVRRRDRAAVAEQLEALRANAPASVQNLRYVAAIYEAIGDTDQALAAFTQARQLAPEDAPTLVAQGQMLWRLQQTDAARDAFRAALDIRPQDAATRELLEQIEPQQRADEAYAVEEEELLARRGESGGFPLTTLQDLTVNTVFENGLGSSFRQIAVQVHDDEGARQFRTYAIQFDPTSQRVDVRLARVHRADGTTLEATQAFEQQLGEPWYRIYYDTRARVVVFPDLEPGDVVELRWRIDDVAHRNLFADYYGDLSFFQAFQPIRHKEYVLITPEGREFFFNEPSLEGLAHARTTEDGQRIDRYVAEDVPAIRSEPNMPGFTEIAPYLHVSTYRTWEDVGTWYWGLIQDQLIADEALKRTVRELVAGKETLREKVVAIHDWVVENTRYVGLEFGIHGYKPYRVTQIVQRGFGDCKDKASLLYTMFREAGIDAHMVLVRTRRNGRITDLPASLAVFDHAIAYVPELDLYIDGTAEHSGVTELPEMDQGVTVLHVWPEGSELRRTPVLPPERNRRQRTLDVRLAADGSATIEGREVITGAQAPGYRSTYQAEGTRSDRFERSLRNLFPGLRLEEVGFEGLDTLEGDVSVRYEAEVPQLAQRDGQRLRADPSTMGELTRAFARTPTREYPMDLGGTSSYVEERTVRLPRGAQAAQVPEGGTAESPFGKLAMTVERSAGQVQMRTEFELRRDRLRPGEYAAFRRWVEEVDQILRQRLILETGSR